ncbi:uncharacterized protein LOC117782756 [Drosophila innubila]|uniref:uncharacterized protein LOC117782756 n=1 Tax=Drosophila innubila TaxID=198719 RepID=UPI00148CD46A|nr:uncharacterized protein LOC117782756 [Drosophila innubila]
MSPCLHECIFNARKVLSGKQLNVENAERMLQELLGNNKDFVDVYSTQSCCRFPDVNFKPYEKRCGHFMLDGLHIWPCSFECIYKAAGVLNGTQLVLDKVDLMMDQLFKDQQHLKDVFVEGFVKCKSKEEEILKTLKRRRFPNKAKCSPLAMLYGICAYKHVFNNCPNDNWTNSSMCNRIRACEQSRLT